MDVKILGTAHIPFGFGLVSGDSLFPAHTRARSNRPFAMFLSNHVRLRGIDNRDSLGLERPFLFGLYPSSFSTILHRHRAVSQRFLLDHDHVKSPSICIIALISCTHLGELGFDSSCILANGSPSILVRGCVQSVSENCACRPLSPYQYELMSGLRASHGFLIGPE